MRIAVPTNDGTTVSEHFGRSRTFVVFEIQDGQIRNRELRANSAQHSHEQGSCGKGSEAHGSHNHAGLLAALAGCDAVICAGMGWRAAEALKSAGIASVIAAAPGSVEDAIARYLEGNLATNPDAYCACRH